MMHSSTAMQHNFTKADFCGVVRESGNIYLHSRILIFGLKYSLAYNKKLITGR